VTDVIGPSAAVGRLLRSKCRDVPQAWTSTKRIIDVTVSAVVLTTTAPLVLSAMAGIALVTGGSPIFMQERVGRNGRPFMMFKLRTMVRGAHLLHDDMRPLSEVDGPVFKMRDDPRLHVLGAFLRRTSIDEIPNFINVLRGEMAVVGPRPPLPSEVANYDAYARQRLEVKPGVTCLWQISGRSALSFDAWMALDNTYIEHWSPLLDLSIIARTIPAVIRGIGAH
jgi:lipopolysaccharide/colanic/teichoic acid biosynthesis glycosyltransferase